MLFDYTAINEAGKEQKGTIESVSLDVAISALQRRGFVISSIKPEGQGNIFERNYNFLERVSNKERVILSRQIATLFGAHISAVRVFRLLADESENPLLKRTLTQVVNDLEGGSSISKALSMHPKVFTDFYVNIVRAGEESGKIANSFISLADHLDRTYELASKAGYALVYPAFVVVTFVGVMYLLLTTVIPKLSDILLEAGQDIPFYTKVVIAISDFLTRYGPYLIIAVIIGGIGVWRYAQGGEGKLVLDRLKLSVPYVGKLYRTLYLSRIADNMDTMLTSSIPMVRGLEITAEIVGSGIYRTILLEVADSVRTGTTVSDAMSKYEDVPGIMIAMVRVGEETGELGEILKTLATFYRREVFNNVEALVSLIQPALIIFLAGGVGVVLASVLIPIYNIAGGI